MIYGAKNLFSLILKTRFVPLRTNMTTGMLFGSAPMSSVCRVLKQIDCTNRTSATNDKENVLGKRSENFQKDDTLAKQNFVPKRYKFKVYTYHICVFSILKKHKTKRDELKTVRFTLPLPVVLDVAHRRSARVQAQKSRSIAHLRYDIFVCNRFHVHAIGARQWFRMNTLSNI